MLFGSGAIFAIVMSSMSGVGQPVGVARTEAELQAVAGPAPSHAAFVPAAVDLRLRTPQDQPFNLKSYIPKTPLEVKSLKICGASGFSVFAPISKDAAIGVGVTAFKIQPGQRALQGVVGVRFRF